MQWTDEAIVLGVRPHGETAALVDLLTRTRGRHAALVHGGRSRRLRPVLQTGNHVDVRWQARLEDHLGFAILELRRGFAADALDDAAALAGLTSLAALARLLPERDPHPDLYEITHFVLGYLEDRAVWPALLVRWELALIGELGFGLDLTACAATGTTLDLIYVSPKSGRAVSRAAGEPYADRLLPLPAFLRDSSARATPADVCAGFTLTGYFLVTRVLAPRQEMMPEPRGRLLGLLAADG
jgi:DNA repair protein RecO (recombination protein O)